MKTDSENFDIKNMVRFFNNASYSAGFRHTMVYNEEAEKIIIDGNEELTIHLWNHSPRACFREVIKGLYWMIMNGEAYND